MTQNWDVADILTSYSARDALVSFYGREGNIAVPGKTELIDLWSKKGAEYYQHTREITNIKTGKIVRIIFLDTLSLYESFAAVKREQRRMQGGSRCEDH